MSKILVFMWNMCFCKKPGWISNQLYIIFCGERVEHMAAFTHVSLQAGSRREHTYCTDSSEVWPTLTDQSYLSTNCQLFENLDGILCITRILYKTKINQVPKFVTYIHIMHVSKKLDMIYTRTLEICNNVSLTWNVHDI